MKPNADAVRAALSYDPDSGIFVWRHRPDMEARWNTKNAGKLAGSKHNGGYIHIALGGIKYLAHHLAWVYMTGEWPASFVDHKNLDKADNRWGNLRLASFGENSANAGIRKDNTSGFRGVHYKPALGVWHAKINKDGKEYYLGAFKTAELAAKAYAKKAQALYGEFCPEYLTAAA